MLRQKRVALLTMCAAAFTVRTWAQSPPTAPRSESDTKAVALAVPDRQVWLGTVQLPATVLADGQPLPAGRYRVCLTGKHAATDVVGQSEQLERWVEFVQGNQVKGRALAPVVPASDARAVAHEALPARGTARIERLKDGDYYRVWFNYKGDRVMVYLPVRGRA
jgi:hypothetical protein